MCHNDYNIKIGENKHLTEERVKYIENWINEYPRLIFGYKNAKEKLKKHII